MAQEFVGLKGRMKRRRERKRPELCIRGYWSTYRAIILLLIIAIASIIGTIIEQDQPIEIYKANYPLINPLFGFLSWDIILRFGFDHVYSTWWFLCFIFILSISLITCSIVQQIPSLKVARRCQFLRTFKQFYKLKLVKNLQVDNLTNIFFKNWQNLHVGTVMK